MSVAAISAGVGFGNPAIAPAGPLKLSVPTGVLEAKVDVVATLLMSIRAGVA